MIEQHDKQTCVTTENASPVLCVDLDGSLLATDILWESILVLLKKQPWMFFVFPLWIAKGKAYFKRQVSSQVKLNAANLPFRQDVLKYLYEEKKRGRDIVLATASDLEAAQEIAQHLNLFDKVIASEGVTNLSGHNKRKVLEENFSENGFEYIGNGTVDLPIWQVAKGALIVQPTKRLLKKAGRTASVARIFTVPQNRLQAVFKAMRPHQWVKNLLIFVPLVMAHKVADITLFIKSCYAFAAFSLCASSVYLLNDLLDLDSDRQHPKKKLRPFAAGTLPIPVGIFAVPTMLLVSFFFAYWALPLMFLALLGCYFIVTTLYSVYFKRIAILDILILAGLYSFRVLAGGVAVDVKISAWLLAFSMFLFLSLAIVKRYTELAMLELNGKKNTAGRGYRLDDMQVLQSMGTASGYLSVLVLALYINSQEVTVLYNHPMVLWLICPLLLYWITRMWFLANRGEIEDDPIVSTIKDPFSYGIGAAIAILLAAAL